MTESTIVPSLQPSTLFPCNILVSTLLLTITYINLVFNLLLVSYSVI